VVFVRKERKNEASRKHEEFLRARNNHGYAHTERISHIERRDRKEEADHGRCRRHGNDGRTEGQILNTEVAEVAEHTEDQNDECQIGTSQPHPPKGGPKPSRDAT